MKIRESAPLQTVLAMYDQETDRNLLMPSYPRLHIHAISKPGMNGLRQEYQSRV